MHDSLARFLAEGTFEILAVVCVEVVAGNRLAAILVYPLGDLVSGSVSETGEKREELGTGSSASLVLEDDRVELRRPRDLQS